MAVCGVSSHCLWPGFPIVSQVPYSGVEHRRTIVSDRLDPLPTELPPKLLNLVRSGFLPKLTRDETNTLTRCSLCLFTRLSSLEQSDKHPHWADATCECFSILHFAVSSTKSCFVAQVGLKLFCSCLSLSSGWDYIRVPLYSAYLFLS